MSMNLGNKVVYQIYPKSFQDTNGDGIGDLKGITSRLDYIKELGVDYLWITPFFVSPQNDNGYDIADYRSIDPMYGTMEDFEELVREAAKRDIYLMVDMVFNHCSTKHEWFQKALAGDPYYRDFFIFRKGKNGLPPTNWVSNFGGSAWSYLPQTDEYYLHLFHVTQADLNWENPNVRRACSALCFSRSSCDKYSSVNLIAISKFPVAETLIIFIAFFLNPFCKISTFKAVRAKRNCSM